MHGKNAYHIRKNYFWRINGTRNDIRAIDTNFHEIGLFSVPLNLIYMPVNHATSLTVPKSVHSFVPFFFF